MTYCIYRSVFHLKKATIKEKKKKKTSGIMENKNMKIPAVIKNPAG